MSMISAQIDELRKMADGQATYRDAREVMLQAADTIWQLRDDLQRAHGLLGEADREESRAWDRVRKAEAEADKLRSCLSDDADNARQIMGENAKLRELIADLWEYIYIGTAQDGQSLHDRTRELGVEVDG